MGPADLEPLPGTCGQSWPDARGLWGGAQGRLHQAARGGHVLRVCRGHRSQAEGTAGVGERKETEQIKPLQSQTRGLA